MRQFLAIALASATVLSGWGISASAQAGDEHAVYYSACVKQTSGNTKMCGCLADLAMTADPQLRADMILSMSNPDKYRTTRAPHVPNNGPEMSKWEQFDVDGQKKCGMDI